MKKIIYFLVFILICSCFVPVMSSNDSLYVWSEMSSPEAITTSGVLDSKNGNFLNLTCGRSNSYGTNNWNYHLRA